MTGEDLRGTVAASMSALPAGPLGVAVSGGGDSLALLVLLHDWARGAGREIEAATVDHRLRPESAAEAAAVAAVCAARGVPHATLVWDDAPGRGNLQAAARDARRQLLAAWARERGLAAVALGHTLDDQAETFLMRLARGSGVDGLAAMAPAVEAEGVLWLRPILGLRRAALRAALAAEGLGWAEDPGNEDAHFLRVRARRALGPLAALGLGPERLAATAAAMARAREALEAGTAALAAECLEEGRAGDVTLDPGPFATAPEELRLRLLAGAVCWVAGARFRPRLAALAEAEARIAGGALAGGISLHGCVIRTARGRIAIRREPAAAAAAMPWAAGRWDGRWALDGTAPGGGEGLVVGALGAEGLAARPLWRDAGLPREALLTTPALWRGARLVAAPILDRNASVTARRIAPLRPPWRRS